MSPPHEPHAVAALLMQYLGLGAVFVLGLVFAWREGFVGLGTPRQRGWLLLMLGGYGLYAGIHAFFQLVAWRW